MKRILLVLLALAIMDLQNVALAQNRGVLTNVYASWVSVVSTATKTVTLPSNSRDIWIQNGSSTDVCVDLSGGSITGVQDTYGICNDDSSPTKVFQMDGPSEIHLFDFTTGAVSFRTISGTASPVSVVVTY